MDRVCLLITVFNRPLQLRNSLSRLCNLTIPTEILIVDDGSEDSVHQVVQEFENILPIRYIYNNNREWSICSMARNIGIKNTDCEIVITSEPEILFITDVIGQMLEYHTRIPGKVISAGTIYHMGHQATLHHDMITDPVHRLQLELVNDSGHGTNPTSPNGYARIQGWVAPFAALYRREWLMELQGWDEQFIDWGWDDTDLLTRLSFNGVGQEIARDIECIHQWHEKLPADVQFRAVQYNEGRMNSKTFEKANPDNDLVANKGLEWGIIKSR